MNRMIATVTSLALTSAVLLPAPAQADGDDLARALAGIVAVGIIAKAIDSRSDRSRETARAGRLGSIEQTYYYNGRVIDGEIRDYKASRPKATRGYKKLPLPKSCLRWIETRRGDRLAYGSQCLDRRFKHAKKLPDHCETAVRTSRGFRTVYGATCLGRDGWVVARR